MFIDCVVVKGETKGFSCSINIVNTTATNNLKVGDFTPFPLIGTDENGEPYSYAVVFRILGAPTADAKVLVEHIITTNTDITTEGQINNPDNGEFTFLVTAEDTHQLGLGKFPIQIILADEETLEPVFTLTEGGEKGEFSKVQIVQV